MGNFTNVCEEIIRQFENSTEQIVLNLGSGEQGWWQI